MNLETLKNYQKRCDEIHGENSFEVYKYERVKISKNYKYINLFVRSFRDNSEYVVRSICFLNQGKLPKNSIESQELWEKVNKNKRKSNEQFLKEVYDKVGNDYTFL